MNYINHKINTMTIFVGISGSGKTTLLKKLSIDENQIINCDRLRQLFGNCLFQNKQASYALDFEPVVWETFNNILFARIFQGNFIIIDNTNLNQKNLEHLLIIAKNYNYQINIVLFESNVTKSLNRQKNIDRIFNVPEDVIVQQHNDYQKTVSWLKQDKIINKYNYQIINSNSFIDQYKQKPSIINIYNNKISYNDKLFDDIKVIGDVQGDIKIANNFLNMLKKNPKTLFIFNGDFIDKHNYIYEEKEAKSLLDIFNKVLGMKNFIGIYGNHDYLFNLAVINNFYKFDINFSFEKFKLKIRNTLQPLLNDNNKYYLRKIAKKIYETFVVDLIINLNNKNDTLINQSIYISHGGIKNEDYKNPQVIKMGVCKINDLKITSMNDKTEGYSVGFHRYRFKQIDFLNSFYKQIVSHYNAWHQCTINDQTICVDNSDNDKLGILEIKINNDKFSLKRYCINKNNEICDYEEEKIKV